MGCLKFSSENDKENVDEISRVSKLMDKEKTDRFVSKKDVSASN